MIHCPTNLQYLTRSIWSQPYAQIDVDKVLNELKYDLNYKNINLKITKELP